jgi:hypothetical protein
MNTMKKIGIGSVLLLGGAGLAMAMGSSLSRDDVRQRLQAAGYLEVHDLERDEGLWEAEVRRADGRYGEVAVDAGSGEIYDAADGRTLLDATAVRNAIEAGGYTDVHDLDREGAIWEAEARDSAGRPVDLRLSGIDAHVISVSHDDDDGDED